MYATYLIGAHGVVVGLFVVLVVAAIVYFNKKDREAVTADATSAFKDVKAEEASVAADLKKAL